jgi:nitrogen regulatory protein PII
MGISAILMRGEGDATARVLLDSGICVPVITFGIGTGLRDKVGLWRITIPAEKEVINGICEANDAETIMNMMIDHGQLDKPGKGFIFIYPINQGLINTKFYIGMPAHAASMEQIIYSIDELKGDTTWRRREGATTSNGSGRKFLLDLVDINLYCKEGNADVLVQAAMDAGATGATITRLKVVSDGKQGANPLFPAMELCNMSVAPQQVESIMNALKDKGAFSNESQGFAVTYPVPKACTYPGN